MIERHSDPFFESVRNELHSLEVVPPDSAYAGMRKRMNSKTNWFSLNTVVVAVILGAMTAGTLYLTDEGQAEAIVVKNHEPRLDAVLTTGQSRLQDRDQMLERKNVTAAEQNSAAKKPSTAGASASKTKVIPTKRTVATIAEEVTVPPNELIITKEETQTSQQIVECESHAPAEQPTAILPENWSEQVGALDPQNIMNQVSDGNDVIHLSIPVKVSVEDKD